MEVLIHKQLTSLPAFTGLCVHEAIERWFELKRGGTTLSVDDLYEEARERFREGWRASTGGLWKEDPRKSVHLIEHHYDEEVSEERTEAARERLETASQFFTDSPLLKTVRAAHYRFTFPAKFEADLVIADEGLPAYGKVCAGEDAIDRMLAPVVSRLQLMGVL